MKCKYYIFNKFDVCKGVLLVAVADTSDIVFLVWVASKYKCSKSLVDIALTLSNDWKFFHDSANSESILYILLKAFIEAVLSPAKIKSAIIVITNAINVIPFLLINIFFSFVKIYEYIIYKFLYFFNDLSKKNKKI